MQDSKKMIDLKKMTSTQKLKMEEGRLKKPIINHGLGGSGGWFTSELKMNSNRLKNSCQNKRDEISREVTEDDI